MKILFFGTSIFAKNILESMLSDGNFNIIALVTQPDKPFGRKKELKSPATKEYLHLQQINIPIFQPLNLRDTSFIYSMNPDLILVVAYGNIIPRDIIDNFLCINIHASILPHARGASPIQEMILCNLSLFGISIIRMGYNLDDGDILGIRYVENDGMNIDDANQLLSKISFGLFKKVIEYLDIILPIPQIHCDSTYCSKINKCDGLISFDDSRLIYLKYLAYKSWPQIFLPSGTKLYSISLNEYKSSNIPGTILSINQNDIVVGCGKGSIIIGEIQDPGKNKLLSPVYLLGKRLKIGDTLS